ncbi:hypothetical protein GM418_00695 [Maribellus comscasis]|uniref:Glycosyl hydrolase 94 catalytic domain-containing protein n=1 Tax=Maribellus comscasis TaxID=2681766 RepID=A0A6I6JWT1_9BACT|nr:amylo-alpha-1,6-glucosidase [Maribellus comscasis]QGY42224.1 hypothetical protein GM418_00695 [Maribellus comscasis]
MKSFFAFLLFVVILLSCSAKQSSERKKLADKINTTASISYTKSKALEIIKTGFNAGDGYSEVWIRDYNTFIELASEVYSSEDLKKNLLVFFRMQGDDGNIIDGFVPKEKAYVDYDYITSELESRYVGHKNTVETDQESSLIQAVYKYIKVTGDSSVLSEKIGNKTVLERIDWAIEFLLNHRFSEEYGLIWGATTADWGDVQPEHGWGVDIDENTHRAIDIYDNAMLLIALDNLLEIQPQKKKKWGQLKKGLTQNCRKYLWDKNKQKFKPHIYLDKSPFSEDFNEDEIYYFGGTATAIEAGLLSKNEIKSSLKQMVALVKKAGAASIGLTLYPAYPEGFFANKIMNPEYSYQNGGDWTWFGGRMIQQLIKYGFLKEAFEQLVPMTERVMKNDGFYEWYTIDNQPRGSGTFRGSAGVLFVAIQLLEKEIARN